MRANKHNPSTCQTDIFLYKYDIIWMKHICNHVNIYTHTRSHQAFNLDRIISVLSFDCLFWMLGASSSPSSCRWFLYSFSRVHFSCIQFEIVVACDTMCTHVSVGFLTQKYERTCAYSKCHGVLSMRIESQRIVSVCVCVWKGASDSNLRHLLIMAVVHLINPYNIVRENGRGRDTETEFYKIFRL